MKIIVVIPAYNESRTLGAVVEGCKKYADEVIVVNDGSTDNTETIARRYGARVVSHMVNRGYGAALKTGLVASVARGADMIVTIDADGQHESNDILRVITPLQNGKADIVIGDRFGETSQREGMSPLRRLFIAMGNLLTWILYGVWLRDTQSGFRAYTRHALGKLSLEAEGMEFSSETVGEASRRGIKIALVPITVRYTDYSLGKGQNFLLGVKTAFQLIVRRLLK